MVKDPTLKEKLETLRGEPIQVFARDPSDIPSTEVSDSERMCKHPLVSVWMITYNHESYIRQAIEGVMMQKTDFEFELVIGEDCSTDATRKICLDYQKKHPDKIRVLWSDHNLYSIPDLGGDNLARTTAQCRGVYIAACEGDDYWIDPLKLQKQVDVFRANSDVTLCFTGAKLHDMKTGRDKEWNAGFSGFEPGRIPAKKFALWTMFGKDPPRRWGPEFFTMTCTIMYRADVMKKARCELDIFKWRLNIGDTTILLGMASYGDVWYLPEAMGVYRVTSTGASNSNTAWCAIDNKIVRLYYLSTIFNFDPGEMPSSTACSIYDAVLMLFLKKPKVMQRDYVRLVFSVSKIRNVFLHWRTWPGAVVLFLNLLTPFTFLWLMRWHHHMPGMSCPKRLLRLYEQYGK